MRSQYYHDAWSIILQAVTSAMDNNDPFIRVAIDGREPTDADGKPATNGTAPPSGQPAMFFYVLFGLVFETLVTSTPESGMQNVRNSIISLKALKHLVKSEYAGNAFNDVPIFEELVNLCYRMALTEPVAVQLHLVDSLASLASSIAKSQRYVESCLCYVIRANYDVRAREEQGHPPQVHCLRICAYILKRVINNTRDKAIRT
jgi:HEAT repeat-containing protein 5